MTKPIIGIIGWPYKDIDNYEVYEVPQDLVESITRAGGIPITIYSPQTFDFQNNRLRDIPELTFEEKQEFENTLKMCDAIVKPGGLRTYDFERYTYDYARAFDVPYLGICAGMQMMASSNKDRISNVKIESSQIEHKSSSRYAHDVKIIPGTKLYNIVGEENIIVNSRHSYTILDAGCHDICAYSEDGVVEAIENPYRSFCIGVQWHPESMGSNDFVSNQIFNKLVDAGRNYQKIKKR